MERYTNVETEMAWYSVSRLIRINLEKKPGAGL